MRALQLRRLRAIDPASAATVLMVLIAIGIYLFSVRPLGDEIHLLQDQLAARDAQAMQARREATVEPAGAQVEQFYGRLPAANDAPEVMRRLHAFASRAGLELKQGDYQPLADPSPRLVPYQIILPTRGDYGQIRRFLSDAMNEFPALALDGIEFRRDDKGAKGRLEAQLRLTLFLRRSA